jgi:hypothetical protein
MTARSYDDHRIRVAARALILRSRMVHPATTTVAALDREIDLLSKALEPLPAGEPQVDEIKFSLCHSGCHVNIALGSGRGSLTWRQAHSLAAVAAALAGVSAATAGATEAELEATIQRADREADEVAARANTFLVLARAKETLIDFLKRTTASRDASPEATAPEATA